MTNRQIFLKDFLAKKHKRNRTSLSEHSKNSIINILKNEHKFGSSITDLVHEKNEYDLKYENFEKNKIYVTKYENKQLIALIYFSKSNQDFIIKTIGKEIYALD